MVAGGDSAFKNKEGVWASLQNEWKESMEKDKGKKTKR